MRLLMNIYAKIKQYPNFTNAEQLVADFILAKPQEFIGLSMEEISTICYVSSPTIYRFCKKLGLSGAAELKVQLSAGLDSYLQENSEFDYDYPIKQNQTQYEIIHALKEDYEQTAISTLNLFDIETLRLAALCLSKAKVIDIYTTAGNIFFAENFQFQMMEIGVPVNVPVDPFVQGTLAASSDNSHVAIVISFGGRGYGLLSKINLLKKNQTKIILITSTQENELYPYADYKIYMASKEDHYNKISSFSTRFSLLYILDVLYTCYFKLDYEENTRKKLAYYCAMTGKK